MKLTPDQLDLISKEIIEGGIKYQDLYEELLDHYILAIEGRLNQGQVFEKAFEEVNTSFENYRPPLIERYYYDVRKLKKVTLYSSGLSRLQRDYERNLDDEISKRHWQIMKEYFRWPTILTSLLVGGLTFQFAYLVPRSYFEWIINACILGPLIMILPKTLNSFFQYLFNIRKFVQSLKTKAINNRIWLITGATNLAFRFPSSKDYNFVKQGNLIIIAFFLCFYIAYSLSFYQLYRERFKVKMA